MNTADAAGQRVAGIDNGGVTRTQPPALGWRYRWHRFRNKFVANPAFQHWAARTPLVSRIANARATELHHITAGFVYSQTLAAIVDLNVLPFLAAEPQHTDNLAARTGLTAAAIQTLLKASTALGITECYHDDWWGLGELGAAMQANPGIGAMVAHHRYLYADLADPLALLRNRANTQLSGFWNYQTGDAQAKTLYSHLMAESQGLIAEHVLDSVNLATCRHLVDIAGGLGAFANRVLARYPALPVTVFDLPEVVAAGQSRTQHQQPAPTFVAGDMFSGPLPSGVDRFSLIRVLHDHDDGPVNQLLQRLHDALSPGGSLLIAEPLAGTPGSESIGDTYFGMYLWAMGSGRPRSCEELTAMLQEAGFINVREMPSAMPCLVRVITAEKKDGKF